VSSRCPCPGKSQGIGRGRSHHRPLRQSGGEKILDVNRGIL